MSDQRELDGGKAGEGRSRRGGKVGVAVMKSPQ